jgi:hypothetical protein
MDRISGSLTNSVYGDSRAKEMTAGSSPSLEKRCAVTATVSCGEGSSCLKAKYLPFTCSRDHSRAARAAVPSVPCQAGVIVEECGVARTRHVDSRSQTRLRNMVVRAVPSFSWFHVFVILFPGAYWSVSRPVKPNQRGLGFKGVHECGRMIAGVVIGAARKGGRVGGAAFRQQGQPERHLYQGWSTPFS